MSKTSNREEGNSSTNNTDTEVSEDDQHSSSSSSSSTAQFGRKNSAFLQEWNPKNIHVLVVDDESTARLIAARVLKKCGYRAVTVVEGGKQALALMDKQEFNLVLCDLHMPDLDGIGVVQQVRKRHDAHKDVPIVMVSATEDLDMVYKCLKDGADDYIIKPIQLSAAKNLWQNVWRKRKERDYVHLLSDEKKKRREVDKEMLGLKKQIEALQSQFSEAVETPINVITKTVASISMSDSLTEEVRVALSQIVKALGSSNLYRPAFNKALSGDDGVQIDDTVREWLSGELTYDRMGEEEEKKIHQWPAIGVQSATETTAILRDWEFDVWSYEEEDLLPLLEEMFKDFDLIDRFKVPPEKLRNFILDVRSGYHKTNPYHNFRHAFDVTQACYFFLTTGGASEFLTQIEIFALLIAALCHDYDHPGLNNNFQVNTDSALALRYNDKSILENYHCASTFQILRKPENQILQNLTEAEFRELRKLIINCILATDMARHMETVSRFSAVLETFTRDNKEHRQCLLEVLLKCADISNPARPASIALYWAHMVQEEFFCQGDIEQARGLPVSPFMDRQTPATAKMSAGFIDFFVSPLYSVTSKLLPKMSACSEHLLITREKWSALLDAETKTEEENNNAAIAASLTPSQGADSSSSCSSSPTSPRPSSPAHLSSPSTSSKNNN